jgi:hypothetical protein
LVEDGVDGNLVGVGHAGVQGIDDVLVETAGALPTGRRRCSAGG